MAIHLPSHIAARVRQALDEIDTAGAAIDQEARRHGAIALMGTIGSIWMLRPDGTFWDADEDWGKPLQPLEERFHLMALAIGVERFPWLEELLPRRPPGAVACPDCGGSGVRVPAREASRPSGGGHFCERCQCLGWIGGQSD
jgi:hypothetical protein